MGKLFSVLVILVMVNVAAADWVVYQDGFESGLGGYTLTGTPTTSTTQVHEGSYSLMTTNSGQRARQEFAATTDAITAECWMYDGGGARAFMQVTAYSDGWGAGLEQLFAIGKYSSTDFNGEVYNGTKYQARIAIGNGGTGSWFNLNAAGSPNRSVGWHKFTMDVADDWSKVSFYVDGILSREVGLTSAAKPVHGFSWVSYGLGAGTTSETFYYDQASISVPEPTTLLLLAGAAAFLRRRRA